MEVFPKMCDILSEGEVGTAKLEEFTVTEKDSEFTRLLQAAHPGRDVYVPPGDYMRLRVDGGVMMTDTPMERRSNLEFFNRAKGDVLIGGLGLGMALLAIQNKKEVTSVTVYEKSRDVIDLVTPQLHLHDNIFIVHTDVHYVCVNEKDVPCDTFDTIYMDIWPTICVDNFEEMLELRRLYVRRLEEGGWFGCWSWDDVVRHGGGIRVLSRLVGKLRRTEQWISGTGY